MLHLKWVDLQRQVTVTEFIFYYPFILYIQPSGAQKIIFLLK